MSRRRVAIALALAVAITASPAAADRANDTRGDLPDPAADTDNGIDSPVDADERAESQRLFRAGAQAYESGHFRAAARLFEKAHARLPLPAIAFSAAQAYRLQYYVDSDPRWLLRAIEHYQRYIEKMPRGSRRTDAIIALAALGSIRTQLEAADGRAGARLRALDSKLAQTSPADDGSTQLMVACDIPDARVRIGDGDADDPVPLIREVAPGPHAIEVTADGYLPSTQTATAVAGQITVVSVALRPRPALVTVDAAPGARIALDGQLRGIAPLAPLELAPGRHVLAVTRRGHRSWTAEIEVARAETRVVHVALAPTTRRRAAFVALGTAGAAAVAAGIAAALAASAHHGAAELEDRRQSDGLSLREFNEFNSLKSSVDTRRRWTAGLAGFALATAVAGGWLYWFDQPQVPGRGSQRAQTASRTAERGGVRAVPMLGPDALGVSVGGRF